MAVVYDFVLFGNVELVSPQVGLPEGNSDGATVDRRVKSEPPPSVIPSITSFERKVFSTRRKLI